MPQQEVQILKPATTDALQIPEGVLPSPEPTAEELDERRAKLALDIEAAQRRQAAPPRRFADD